MFKLKKFFHQVADDNSTIDEKFKNQLRVNFTGSKQKDTGLIGTLSVFRGIKYATGLAAIAVLVIVGAVNYGGSNNAAHQDSAINANNVGIESASLNEVSAQNELVNNSTDSVVQTPDGQEVKDEVLGVATDDQSSDAEEVNVEDSQDIEDVSESESEADDDDADAVSTTDLIRSVNAITIAQAEFSDDKFVTSVKLEQEGNKYVYQIEFSDESEVEVDAQTGVVIKTEDKAIL